MNRYEALLGAAGVRSMPGYCPVANRPLLVPRCHNHTEEAPWAQRVGPGPDPPMAMHVGFFDDRATPNWRGIQRTLDRVRALETSDAPVVAHLVVVDAPGQVPVGGHLHVLRGAGGAEGQLARCLYRNMGRSARGMGRHYLYKPVLHLLLPPHIEKLIMLDTDTVFVRPLSELWAEFGRFLPMAVLGVAPEQNDFYTPLPGKNGGVQLLHLRRMRASRLYTKLLDWHASGLSTCRSGYLGDQTVYSILEYQSPLLIHHLPCEWNRQLAPTEPSNSPRYACGGRCGLLHGNGVTKCAVDRMHTHNASCAAWRVISRGDSLPGDAACLHGNVRFRRVAERHFGDCCVGG